MRRVPPTISASVVVLALAFASAATTSAAGAKPTPKPAGGSGYIVLLADGVPVDSTIAALTRAIGAPVGYKYRNAIHAFSTTLTTSQLSSLRADHRVAAVEPDSTFTVSLPAADPAVATPTQTLPLAVERIAGDRSSTKSGDGHGTVNANVAILDTGIAPQPDLNLAGGAVCNGKDYIDRIGHGTFVSGLAGAIDNTIGVVGVAPGVRLWAVKVFSDKGVATNASVLCGIDWVAGTRKDADPGNDITVANMSLVNTSNRTGDCGTSAIHLAICNATAAGVTFVVAAGNDTTDFANYIPATYPEVLTVTAMADNDGAGGGAGGAFVCATRSYVDDTPAVFSNFATLAEDRAHTIAAPGACVLGMLLNGGFGLASGTSYSTPLVTGTVALCVASGACAGLTPSEIVAKIIADAAAQTSAKPRYGFDGDPTHPIAGRFYGPLTYVGGY